MVAIGAGDAPSTGGARSTRISNAVEFVVNGSLSLPNGGTGTPATLSTHSPFVPARSHEGDDDETTPSGEAAYTTSAQSRAT